MSNEQWAMNNEQWTMNNEQSGRKDIKWNSFVLKETAKKEAEKQKQQKINAGLLPAFLFESIIYMNLYHPMIFIK
jgi:hypothetical protein